MAFTSTILIYSLLALSFAVIWQVLGSQLLALITKKIFSDQNFAHLVAWVAWPAWSGAMAFSVFIVARPWHKEALILGAIAILGAGAFTLRHGRIPQRQLSRTSRAVFGLLIVFALLTLLVAATPQQLYDQMNYHLVVAKIAMRQGSLQGSLDNHILMTGIYEYGLLWARALWDNDLFAWGVGQATTWVVCFGTLLWLGVICFREHREVDSDHLRLGCFLTFCLSVIAYNLPESVTFRMFKPDSLIFAVVCVVLFARQWQSKQDFVKSFLILAPIILALKFMAFILLSRYWVWQLGQGLL